jgi:hypothetical protein
MSQYENDILAWSEHQGELLRRIASGQRVNDAEIDWSNISEEIEAVGRNELRACESYLVQALAHILKAEAWPNSQAVPNWRADARHFRNEAAAAFSPSMRQKINLTRLYRRALSELPETIDGQPKLPLPDDCPLSLDELLS